VPSDKSYDHPDIGPPQFDVGDIIAYNIITTGGATIENYYSLVVELYFHHIQEHWYYSLLNINTGKTADHPTHHIDGYFQLFA
jgi:hypothetical protein